VVNQVPEEEFVEVVDEITEILIRDGFGEKLEDSALYMLNRFFKYSDYREHTTTVEELIDDLNYNPIHVARVVETLLGMEGHYPGAEFQTLTISKNPMAPECNPYYKGIVSFYKCAQATYDDAINLLQYVEDLLNHSGTPGVACRVAARLDFTNRTLGRVDLTFIEHGANLIEVYQILYKTKKHDWFMRF